MPRSRTTTNTISIVLILFASALCTSATAQQEPQVRILNEQDLVDILVGSCIFGGFHVLNGSSDGSQYDGLWKRRSRS